MSGAGIMVLIFKIILILYSEIYNIDLGEKSSLAEPSGLEPKILLPLGDRTKEKDSHSFCHHGFSWSLISFPLSKDSVIRF